MIHVFMLMIGLLLLGMGRRLYWLFVGSLGFVVGFQLAQFYLVPQSVWMVWGAGVLLGLISALLAIFFQSLAMAAGGFAAGSTVAAYIASMLGYAATFPLLFAGGLAGLILLLVAFDWALIGLSSLAGATIIVQALHTTARSETFLYAVIVAAGVVFQTAVLRNQCFERK